MDYKASFSAFRSAAETMYGFGVGRTIYDSLAWIAEVAFEGRVTPARPVILAPGELGPYGRSGWYEPTTGSRPGPILLNGQLVRYDHSGGFMIRHRQRFEDALIHQMSHAFQFEYVQTRDGGDPTFDPTRGLHRCRSWYEAVATAAPKVLGFEFPEEIWPRLKSVRFGKTVRKKPVEGTLPESVMTGWPGSLREALENGSLSDLDLEVAWNDYLDQLVASSAKR